LDGDDKMVVVWAGGLDREGHDALEELARELGGDLLDGDHSGP
jgi:hypothetical protein